MGGTAGAGRAGRPAAGPRGRPCGRNPVRVPGGLRVARTARRSRGRPSRRTLGTRTPQPADVGAAVRRPRRSAGLYGVRRPHGGHPRRRAGRARLGGGVGRRLRRGRRRAPRRTGGGRGHRRRAGLRSRPALSPGTHRVDHQNRRTGPGRRRVTAGRASHAEQVHPPQPGHRGAHPGDRGRRGRLSQWRPGHGARRAAAGQVRDGRARPCHQRVVGRGA